MGRVPYTEFVGARARMQRLADQRIFSGWLHELRSDRIWVTSEGPLEIDAGQRFLFQLQGPSADAYLIASSINGAPASRSDIGAVHGNTALHMVNLPAYNYPFAVITAVQLRDGQQTFRKALSALNARMHYYGEDYEVLLTDGSPAGMGALVWRELRQGSRVEITVTSGDVESAFDCEVRHCRPDERLPGSYRVGLKFETADRIALVTWRRLLKGD